MSEAGDKSLDLTNPVELGGQSYKRLSFKELYGGMLMDCGMPVRTVTNDDGQQETVVDMKAIGRLISRSADVPLQVVRRLSPTDFMAAMDVVMGFFPAGTGKSGNPRTSSTAILN